MTQITWSLVRDHKLVFQGRLDRALEVGRQRSHEPGSPDFIKGEGGGPDRLVVAAAKDKTVSRSLLLLADSPRIVGELAAHRAWVNNLLVEQQSRRLAGFMDRTMPTSMRDRQVDRVGSHAVSSTGN